MNANKIEFEIVGDSNGNGNASVTSIEVHEAVNLVRHFAARYSIFNIKLNHNGVVIGDCI